MTHKTLLIVSMPFRIGIGGFLRSRYVLPKLAYLFNKDGYELELYVPVNAVRTYLMAHFNTKVKELHKHDYRDVLDQAFQAISEELSRVEKESKYTITINEKILRRNFEYNKTFFLKEFKQKSLYRIRMLPPLEKFRPFLIRYFEKKFIETIKDLIKVPSYAYSMHETIDAITALTHLSSKNTKTIVLLQLDLGKNLIEKHINISAFKALHIKTQLVGALSVSPTPIIETPELLKLCKLVKVLIPGVAIDPVFLNKKLGSKITNAVTYYGRISKEKGIFDLLKAWIIVQDKIDAHLYIAGIFDNYNTKLKFKEFIKKYNLRTVNYIGYLERDKIPDLISRMQVLAYPSYRDSFSLTVLESLFMGLRVVAYNIPAIRFHYKQSHNVETVPVGDVKGLASTIISNLEKHFEEDHYTKKILNTYSSWDKVISEEFTNLCEILRKSLNLHGI